MTTQQQGVIPHLVIDGASAAIDFYKAALGATETLRMPAQDGKRLMHAELAINGARIFLMDDFPEHRATCGDGAIGSARQLGGTPVMLHLEVENCDAAVARAEAAGAKVILQPFDAFWGARYGQVIDPFGHGWSFAHALPGQQS
ncbi:VOC family protein [Bosea lathyri]|uniref:PhnB protein n=1 Tax=Bosea lathyri TaxID=1036778 RepID=A0A1H6A765_9HYPH|nr:VOC family protein [Bosea lathyri]SEG44281.1 PhnB protein [Bosea lathyri]